MDLLNKIFCFRHPQSATIAAEHSTFQEVHENTALQYIIAKSTFESHFSNNHPHLEPTPELLTSLIAQYTTGIRSCSEYLKTLAPSDPMQPEVIAMQNAITFAKTITEIKLHLTFPEPDLINLKKLIENILKNTNISKYPLLHVEAQGVNQQLIKLIAPPDLPIEEKKAPPPPSSRRIKIADEIQTLSNPESPPTYQEILRVAHLLHTEFHHPNYPFNFEGDNTTPAKASKQFILASIYLNTADKQALMQDDQFLFIYKQSLPFFLNEIKQKLNNGENGFYYGLDIARGGDRRKEEFSEEQILAFFRDQGIPRHNAVLNLSFTEKELDEYSAIIQLTTTIRLNHSLKSTFSLSALIQLQGFANLIEIPLKAYAALKQEDHPSKQLLNTNLKDYIFLTQLLGQSSPADPNELIWIYPSMAEFPSSLQQVERGMDNFDQIRYEHLFLKNPIEFIKAEFNQLDEAFKTPRNAQPLILRCKTFIHLLQIGKIHVSDKKSINYINIHEKALHALLINYMNETRIVNQQKVCMDQLQLLETWIPNLSTFQEVLEFKMRIKYIYQISRDSFQNQNDAYGCLRKTRTTIASMKAYYEKIISAVEGQTFQILLNKATYREEAWTSQFGLPGFTPQTKQFKIPGHETQSPSRHACGAIAAYATYFEMRKNQGNPSPQLDHVMHFGTMRYRKLWIKFHYNPKILQLNDVFTSNTAQLNHETRQLTSELEDNLPLLHINELMDSESDLGFRQFFNKKMVNVSVGGAQLPQDFFRIAISRDSHIQYTELLKKLVSALPSAVPARSPRQIGAILSKGGGFYSIVVTQISEEPQIYSVTITDSHGSHNKNHKAHHDRAFKITFNSLKDAGAFLSIHSPYSKNNGQGQVDRHNTITIYPLTLTKAREAAQFNQDLRDVQETLNEIDKYRAP